MPEYSSEALAILELLRDRHNVLVSGPPGTGKSRLLNEVAAAFESAPQKGPVHVPGAKVAIPKNPPAASEAKSKLPSPEKTERKVFRTVFHQNSKYRDFVTGLTPSIGASGGDTTRFRVVAGTLYRASEHAAKQDGAALLIVDEINRGPAVQIFGGSIVAIESDKRLAANGARRSETQVFELLDPSTGDITEYALPHSLYLLAAMNQADTSVEPLDVAFLRRWTPFRLDPSESVLRNHFKLQASNAAELAAVPVAVADVFEAAVRAWKAVNARLTIGRGREFQIGHGVLMLDSNPPASVQDALRSVAEAWRIIRAHIDEVFFGDVRGIAAVLNVGVAESHPLQLKEATFGDEPRLELVGPDPVPQNMMYDLLRAVSG